MLTWYNISYSYSNTKPQYHARIANYVYISWPVLYVCHWSLIVQIVISWRWCLPHQVPSAPLTTPVTTPGKSVLTLNMLNFFKIIKYVFTVRIISRILFNRKRLDSQWSNPTCCQSYMVKYHACWCPGDLVGQGISRHGIGLIRRTILSLTLEELILVVLKLLRKLQNIFVLHHISTLRWFRRLKSFYSFFLHSEYDVWC